MIQIGKTQTLPIANFVPFGLYLDAGTGDTSDNVLLPQKEVPERVQIGDMLDVFIYRDSEDRPIATTRTPLAQVGDVAYLKIAQNNRVGAFLSWGLEKDLFLPFSEQKYRVIEGRSYLVALYLDKQDRICATTDVGPYLRTDSPYRKNDVVSAAVYIAKHDFGALVAVDNCYAGFIPEQEYYQPIRVGMQLDNLRVVKVREDGKLDLSPRKLAHDQMSDDARLILETLKANKGILPLNDDSHPGAIKRWLHLSKRAFKRAVGQLLKEEKIEQTEWGIRLSNDE